jgi:serine/threonine-protein kinase
MFCPRCHRTYTEPGRRFCPDDGASLTSEAQLGTVKARATQQMGAILDGRYAVRGLIGKGGMARVYLAEDTRTKQPVAVKVLNPDIARDRVARERFLREIEVAASIGHPNVVQVLDAGERPDGSPFIVLEFLHGESLGEFLRRDEVMKPEVAVPLLAMAASALAAAHRAGIIHRDLKPDNLYLLGEIGAPDSLKVVDFGMAKLAQASNLSQSGISMGTLGYIAPEQALADPITTRTDIYGLGVVMYRTVTGRLPFDTPDDALLVAQHLFLPPPLPSRVRPGLDPRLETVLVNALRKRPENRYPSMDALLEDFERILGKRPGAVTLRQNRSMPDHYQPVGRSAREAERVLRGLVGL